MHQLLLKLILWLAGAFTFTTAKQFQKKGECIKLFLSIYCFAFAH